MCFEIKRTKCRGKCIRKGELQLLFLFAEAESLSFLFQMGAYHTLDLELNRKFEITKREWDVIALDRVDMACDVTQHADLGAVIMQEGLAHVCLITSSMTLVRSKIDVNIPRKRKGSTSQHEKGLSKFYDAVYQGILRHLNFDVIKCVLLASPGFVKDQFYEYMIQQATKTDNKVKIKYKTNIQGQRK